MRVFVIAEADGRDLLCRVGSEQHPMSPVFRLPGDAQYINGNPILTYKDPIRATVGPLKPGDLITVAVVSSGLLT